MMTMTMGYLAPVSDFEDDVRVLKSSVVIHHCCPGANPHYHRRHVDVLDQYRPASAVRDRRGRGGCDDYHGVGLRSSGLLALRSRDVMKKHDVGIDSRCLARVVLLGSHSDGRGDRRCREVEG